MFLTSCRVFKLEQKLAKLEQKGTTRELFTSLARLQHFAVERKR
jgi:hypothetical protein